MRVLSCVFVGVAISVCTGCTSVRATLFEGFMDSMLCSLLDSDKKIDAHVLKRKGIEPGSKAHKKLEYHEKFSRDFYRKHDSNY